MATDNNLNEGVNDAVDKAQDLYNSNSKTINIVLVAILVIGGGIFSYVKFFQQPLEAEAKEQGGMEMMYSMQDSLNYALDGDTLGMSDGLLALQDEYSSTEQGNLFSYQIGAIYMKKGEFETAIDYLEQASFSGESVFKAMTYGLIGDCKSELEDYDGALSYYAKAAKLSSDPYNSGRFMFKSAAIEEMMNENMEAALVLYKDYMEAYPKAENTDEFSKAKKESSRIEAALAK
jgi:tetratricopeptide (TPR) repeat protein